MDIINDQNPNRVKYFDLRDYIAKIKLDSRVLSHMEETNKEFDAYMKKIKSYNFDDVVHLWLIETAEELASSSQIERHYIDKQSLLKKNLNFDTLDISHKRIHDVHNFVMDTPNEILSYRKTDARVSYYDNDGVEHIYWHGAEAEDVTRFMNTFIDVYKSNDLSVINSNPFLKSALTKLLFVRIHPYSDGNGRTSRVLYSIKFTEAINKIYGTNLKLCPLNISASILLNQITYAKILNNIYFDMEHDTNEYINKWFNFILNMADEQLFYSKSQLDKLDATYNIYAKLDDEEFLESLKRMLYDMKTVDDVEETEDYKQRTLGVLS